jgi:hypothetical protein
LQIHVIHTKRKSCYLCLIKAARHCSCAIIGVALMFRSWNLILKLNYLYCRLLFLIFSQKILKISTLHLQFYQVEQYQVRVAIVCKPFSLQTNVWLSFVRFPSCINSIVLDAKGYLGRDDSITFQISEQSSWCNVSNIWVLAVNNSTKFIYYVHNNLLLFIESQFCCHFNMKRLT